MNSSVFTANCHFVKWEFISWIHLLTAVWWSTVNDVNYVGCVIDLCLALLHSLTNHESSGRSLTVYWPITSRVAFHSQFIDQSWVEWAITHSFCRFLLHICNHKKHLHAQYEPSNKFQYPILISDCVNLILIVFSYIHGVSDNESPMKSLVLLSALPPLGHIWVVIGTGNIKQPSAVSAPFLSAAAARLCCRRCRWHTPLLLYITACSTISCLSHAIR